jgi:hypothetical protein
MLHVDPRLRVVRPELVALCRQLVAEHGLKQAAQEIGLGRATLASVLAGTGSMPGTIAILEGYEARQGRAA